MGTFSCSMSSQKKAKNKVLLKGNEIKINGPAFLKEVEERTVKTIKDDMKLKNLYVAPTIQKNIQDIFEFFPLTPEVVETCLVSHPQILQYPAVTVVEFVRMVVEVGDYSAITQEEALAFITRIPEVLRIPPDKFRGQLSDLFSMTAEFQLPWNMVMIESPRSMMLEPRYVASILEQLQGYFDDAQIRDLVGHNPEIFLERWSDLKDKINFLQKTMNVSAYRLSVSSNSLTLPLSFLEARYKFLHLSGNYRHPDPGAKAARPMEASPPLQQITDSDDSRFVGKCCPGLDMEEWEMFLNIQSSQDTAEEEEWGNDEDEDSDSDEETNHYARQRGVRKSKKDK